MNIAIVGLGTSGNGVLKAFLDFQQAHPNTDFTIHIYDTANHLGHGFPYQEDTHSLIMNSYARNISLDTENPNGFVEWLAANYPEHADPNHYVPRPIFGQYMKDFMKDYMKSDRITIINQLVQDIRVLDNLGKELGENKQIPYQFQLQTADHTWQDTVYQAVFLNIGHPPYADHYHLRGHKGYVHNPYPVMETLGELNPEQKIGIIGSGLTALDAMRYMQNKYEGKLAHSISFYTRSTPFKTARQDYYDGPIHMTFSYAWIDEISAKGNGYIRLDTILEAFFEDMRVNDVDVKAVIDRFGLGSLSEIRHEVMGYDRELQIIQQYASTITKYLPHLYMKMPGLDREKYIHEYMDIFEYFRNQMTKEALLDILNWYDQGRISFQDQLVDIKANSQSGFDIYYKNGSVSHADILINAAGFESNLFRASDQDILIKNLVNREIISPTPYGDVLISWPQGQSISRRFGTFDNLFFTGRWIKNTLYGNNNALMNFTFGQDIVKQFLDRHQK